MPKIVIPFDPHSPPTDNVMSSTRSNSSYEDIEVISLTLMSPQSVLHESRVPPKATLAGLKSKDEEEDLKEDMSLEEDPSMDEEDLIIEPKFMEGDSLQDSSKESI